MTGCLPLRKDHVLKIPSPSVPTSDVRQRKSSTLGMPTAPGSKDQGIHVFPGRRSTMTARLFPEATALVSICFNHQQHTIGWCTPHEPNNGKKNISSSKDAHLQLFLLDAKVTKFWHASHEWPQIPKPDSYPPKIHIATTTVASNPTTFANGSIPSSMIQFNFLKPWRHEKHLINRVPQSTG